MATNFWTSSHARWLISDEKAVYQAHSGDLKYFKSRKHIWELRLYFVEYIHRIGKKLGFRQRVLCTAVVFFKRFYSQSNGNFCDYDPRLVAPTMLFVAAKAEECSLSAVAFVNAVEKLAQERLGPRFPYTKDDLLECEYIALERLQFDLLVWHPYQPLVQFLNDIGMPELLQTAWEIANDSYRTDVILVHPPHIIAIACVYMACVFHDKNCSDWLSRLNVELDKVLDVTRAILDLYDAYALKAQAGRAATATLIEDLLAKLDAVHASKHANAPHTAIPAPAGPATAPTAAAAAALPASLHVPAAPAPAPVSSPVAACAVATAVEGLEEGEVVEMGTVHFAPQPQSVLAVAAAATILSGKRSAPSGLPHSHSSAAVPGQPAAKRRRVDVFPIGPTASHEPSL